METLHLIDYPLFLSFIGPISTMAAIVFFCTGLFLIIVKDQSPVSKGLINIAAGVLVLMVCGASMGMVKGNVNEENYTAFKQWSDENYSITPSQDQYDKLVKTTQDYGDQASKVDLKIGDTVKSVRLVKYEDGFILAKDSKHPLQQGW